MRFDATQAVVPLTPPTPLRLTDARGTRLRCLAGTVWVTVDGEYQDQVLLAGQSLVLETSLPALVTALGGGASVGVCAPLVARSAWRGRLNRWGLGRPMLASHARPAGA